MLLKTSYYVRLPEITLLNHARCDRKHMAIDKNGLIPLPAFSSFQPVFSPLIADTVQRLVSEMPALIHSIYMYDSLAEGRATDTVPDLDLTVIFRCEPDDRAIVKLTAIRSGLEQHYPVVSKIDIDQCVLDTVLLPANSEQWGYWLKYHCICIYGEDLRDHFEPFRPSRNIAIAVNGDFLTVLNGYISRMNPSLAPIQRHALQRAAACKAIQATNILRDENDPDWPATLEEHREKFNVRYPALAEEMDYLLSISHHPRGDIMTFAGRVSTFSYWLNAEFNSRNR
ncbi:nucleotidyltransferase domain-containing protein [Pantoea agglomerans]|uniref:nucleotidyltransferase domain-containing protein n=1 Tax=Enterobacter agglomerans TaxID=549 RepID=UPI001EE87308|nr:nucleotidyltransferase domain-containing protein [Pantoea agglomerans]